MKKLLNLAIVAGLLAFCPVAHAGYDTSTKNISAEDDDPVELNEIQSDDYLWLMDTGDGESELLSAGLLGYQGLDQFTICGDATTVNNNTVYYGPSIVLVAGYGQTCDITAAGNTTEATADAPIYTNKAVHVTGMTCRNSGDANANVSYTLRTAAGATVPSVTCTIADGERDCVADIQTTTTIAAAATVAIAMASSSDVGDTNGQSMCRISVRY